MTQVIDPASEQAEELIAEGADADMLARFENHANEWLQHQGVYDPAAPFTILDADPPRSGVQH